MKKSILALTLASAIFASDKNVADISGMKFFQKTGMKILEVQKLNGLYMARYQVLTNKGTQEGDVFIDSKKKLVILGSAFEDSTGKKVMTKIETEGLIKKKAQMSEDEKKRAMVLAEIKNESAFTFGTGAKEYYIFIDPECPACVEMEKNFEALGRHGKFYVFLMPLSFHKNAREMSLYVLNSEEPQKALRYVAENPASSAYRELRCTDADSNKTICHPDKLNALDMKLKKHLDLAREIKVPGTPSVYSSNGSEIWWGDLINGR